MGHSRKRFCNIELHCFCDSSLQAYSSIIYIRVIANLGVKVILICSKTIITNERNYNSSIGAIIITIIINEIITICVKGTIFEHCKYLLLV